MSTHDIIDIEIVVDLKDKKMEKESFIPYSGKELHFKVEGKSFKSANLYITGAEVKNLVGIPHDVELYLHIKEPYNDELIGNDQQVDLALPGIEEFYTKKPLHYTVNGKQYYSRKQFITGLEIRQYAHIPDNLDLYLDVPGNWNDNKIDNDEQVDLARPGIEKFITRGRKVIIWTNSHSHEYDKDLITYEEVVRLALCNYDPCKGYTVTYGHGPLQNPEGLMSKGDTVYVQYNMEFHVTEAHIS